MRWRHSTTKEASSLSDHGSMQNGFSDGLDTSLSQPIELISTSPQSSRVQAYLDLNPSIPDSDGELSKKDSSTLSDKRSGYKMRSTSLVVAAYFWLFTTSSALSTLFLLLPSLVIHIQTLIASSCIFRQLLPELCSSASCLLCLLNQCQPAIAMLACATISPSVPPSLASAIPTTCKLLTAPPTYGLLTTGPSLRNLRDKRYSASASAFCSTYIQSTVTETAKVAAITTKTDFVTPDAVTVTSTKFMTLQNTFVKRDAQAYPTWLPASYPPSRVSSACSCFVTPSAPVTVTTTITTGTDTVLTTVS